MERRGDRSVLEPESPYRPWRHGFGEAHVGDPVAIVLNTDPTSVLTKLAYIGDDGDPGCARPASAFPT